MKKLNKNQLNRERGSLMREIKATFPDGTREKERISESVGLQQWRDIETGDLKVGGRLFTGESIERATQIEKALEGLTIREAYDLLDRVKTHLLNSIVSPDR